MADPLFYTLLTRLEAVLKAHPGLDANKVSLGRIETLVETDLPYVSIYLNDDVNILGTGAGNFTYTDWNVAVNIEITVSAISTASIDKAYLDVRAAIHNAIMVDEKLGVTFILFAVPEGASEAIFTDTAERRLAVYRTSWIFRVRTSVTDITTA